MESLDTDYRHKVAGLTRSGNDLHPAVEKILFSTQGIDKRVFEIGCGNGSMANLLSSAGFDVVATDPSKHNIELARSNFPVVTFEEYSAYDDLAGRFGTYPAVISLEVVEHLFWPRKFADTAYRLLLPGGVAIISTPYHGYLKNLLIALSGKFDEHWSPLWDGGHIKFWSKKTLRKLLLDAGFSSVEFHLVGRISPIAKSMIAVACKR